MAAGGKTVVQTRWDNEPKSVLLDRIKMLEEEVKILKGRLDDLRKAKNQTIIKREHEFVECGTPMSERDIHAQARARELEEKLGKLRKEHAAKMAEMQEEKDKEIAKLNEEVNKARTEARQGPCGHEDELKDLRTKVSKLEIEQTGSQTEVEAQKDIIDGLWYQLSLKEAEWCDKEEKMLYQFQKAFDSIQDSLSAKVAKQLEAKIAEVRQQTGSDSDVDNCENEIRSEEEEKSTGKAKTTSDKK